MNADVKDLFGFQGTSCNELLESLPIKTIHRDERLISAGLSRRSCKYLDGLSRGGLSLALETFERPRSRLSPTETGNPRSG
jgi:hypothetical protein